MLLLELLQAYSSTVQKGRSTAAAASGTITSSSEQHYRDGL
jgi:hypothetical protein